MKPTIFDCVNYADEYGIKIEHVNDADYRIFHPSIDGVEVQACSISELWSELHEFAEQYGLVELLKRIKAREPKLADCSYWNVPEGTPTHHIGHYMFKDLQKKMRRYFESNVSEMSLINVCEAYERSGLAELV